jgi:CTP:molybdopterin cytidylyltransferase MocA
MVAERTGSIAGVVLAAGSSARMGRNKLLLELEGERVIRRAVRRTLEAGLDPTLVVLGHDADEVRGALAGLPCRPVLNPDWADGMSVSLRAGIAQVPPAAIAAVVVLADMPLVTTEMIAELALRYRRGAAPLVASEYGGVLAPPTLYGRALFPELAVVDAHGCGKHVVKRHRAEAEVVAWPMRALTDLDFPADYERFQAELGPSRMPGRDGG